MKKRKKLIITGVAAVAIAAGIYFLLNGSGANPHATQAVLSKGTDDTNILVVYFSRANEIAITDNTDAVSSASLNLQNGEIVGNTEMIAQEIAAATGADIYPIITKRAYATLLDTPAANAFAEHLPLTLDMTDYVNREKHAHLDFTIDDSDLENIQYPYEIGDIIYYPPGPTFAMYYDHDGREISAGMEVIARLDEEGVATLGSYEAAVKVTVELGN